MYLNPEAFARFKVAYRAGLAAAVEAEPGEYDYPPEQSGTVADRMLRSIIARSHWYAWGTARVRPDGESVGAS